MIGGATVLAKCGHVAWKIRSIMCDFVWCPVCDTVPSDPRRKGR